MEQGKSDRLARNTVYLYGRTVFALLIALYSSRIVLEALGSRDYGIFALVAGFASFFTFFNSAGSEAVMRFLSVAVARRDVSAFTRTYAAAMYIYVAVAGVVVLLAETAGLWAVNNCLDIAAERMFAANFAYQAVVVAAVFSVLEIPCTGAIMAYERMDAFAVISIVHVLLKLVIAVVTLLFATADSLPLYASLYALAAFLAAGTRFIYCRCVLAGARTLPRAEKGVLGEMLAFSGWSAGLCACNMARFQGMYVILNRFGGTVLNAAAALSTQVSEGVLQLVHAILLAFRPRVVKEYASGSFERAARLLNDSACYGFMILAAFAVPLYMNMDFVLRVWLGNVPAYTGDFCRIVLVSGLAQTLTYASEMGLYTAGCMSRAAVVNGGLYVAELPVMFFALKYTGEPPVVLLVHVVFLLAVVGVNMYLLRRVFESFSTGAFMRRAVAFPLVAAGVAFAGCSLVGIEAYPVIRLVVCTGISVSIMGVFALFSVPSAGVRRELVYCITKKCGSVLRIRKV